MAENYKNESMVDVAYSYLKEINKKVKFNDLFNVISERIGFSEEEKENLISNFYTNLSLDGRFVTLGNNEMMKNLTIKPITTIHLNLIN